MLHLKVPDFISNSAFLATLQEQSLGKWQKIAKQSKYFPTISHRLTIHTTLTSELITMLRGHGGLKAYTMDSK